MNIKLQSNSIDMYHPNIGLGYNRFADLVFEFYIFFRFCSIRFFKGNYFNFLVKN